MEQVTPRAMAQPEQPAATAQPQGTAIPCPLVGVFYAAPSPEDAPFVTVGSTVKKGDVLCIVEAMKLMNEITAEKDGVITEICAENGAVVEYGQPLFYLA
jgi:acetyl-CoA carboxylase biotin carboxyl carrier protein